MPMRGLSTLLLIMALTSASHAGEVTASSVPPFTLTCQEAHDLQRSQLAFQAVNFNVEPISETTLHVSFDLLAVNCAQSGNGTFTWAPGAFGKAVRGLRYERGKWVEFDGRFVQNEIRIFANTFANYDRKPRIVHQQRVESDLYSQRISFELDWEGTEWVFAGLSAERDMVVELALVESGYQWRYTGEPSWISEEWGGSPRPPAPSMRIHIKR